MIDELWDWQNPGESEKRFRALIAEAKTQLARSLGLQKKFEEAHRVLDEVADVSEVRVRYLLERGRTFNSSEQPEKARPLFVEALELAKNDTHAVDAAHMLGILDGLEWNLKAIALAESSPDPRAKKWLGSLYNNTGWSYHDAGDFPKALELFEKALAAMTKEPYIRIGKWTVARCYRSLGRVEEALAMQRAILEQDPGDGYIHEEIGECLKALGRAAEAEPFLVKAKEILSK